MRFLLFALLLAGCATDRSGIVIDAVTGAIQSAPEVENERYFSLLPWALTGCGLLVFLFGWYTTDPTDNVPCTVIFGVLLALSLAVAKAGARMALVAELSCYASLVVCIIFYAKDYVKKNFTHNSKGLERIE